MSLKIASSVANMANQITQAIFAGQRSNLEQEYKQQLKQLDALQAPAHDKHWEERAA